MRRKINFFVCGENQIHVWAAELVQQAPLPNAHASDQNLHAKIKWFFWLLKMNRLWYIQYDCDLFYLQETII